MNADVPGIARVLQESKPETIWSKLGDDVTEAYVRHYCTGMAALAVVAVEDGNVVGACLATTDPEHDRRDFYSRSASTLLRLVVAEVARDPQAARSLLRRVGRAIGSAGSSAARALRRREPLPTSRERVTDGHPEALIATLIVSPGSRGRGVATALLERTVDELAGTGAVEWCRVNTTADNIAAQRSMERAGFERSPGDAGQVTFVRPLVPPT